MNPRPPPSRGTSPSDTNSGSPALEWAVANNHVGDVFSCVEAKLRRRRRRRWQIGATTGLAVLALAGGSWWSKITRDPASSTISAPAVAVSLPRQQTLADGTVVQLREGARLFVSFTADFRRVTLESGEAHFQVAKDPSRPFVVAAGGVDVRAVGTAFAVQFGAGAVEVVVTEGRVSVEQPAADAAAAAESTRAGFVAEVDAGQRVMIEVTRASGSPTVVALSPGEIEARLAWRVARLELAATPLVHAVEFFNRHSGTRLELANAALGQLELSGSVRADSPEPLLRLLQAEFGVEIDRRASGEIVLRRR